MLPSAVHAPAKPARANARSRGASPARKTASMRAPDLGPLPEWNLTDLYPGIDAPEVKRDLDRADAECNAFEEAYKGKLGAMASAPDAGPSLVEAVKRY